MAKTAILVDGGFFRKVGKNLFDYKTPEEFAKILHSYCCRHLQQKKYNHSDKKDRTYNELYRIFYYDCAPMKKNVYHPFLQKNIDFSQEPTYRWMDRFLTSLKTQRKVALRLGELSKQAYFTLTEQAAKDLFRNKNLDTVNLDSFYLVSTQKGVDMKIGIDIASLAYKRLVDQIVLISGDSDFVPAAKLARTEGIDFILDPMWQQIRPNLDEHVDGIYTRVDKRVKKKDE